MSIFFEDRVSSYPNRYKMTPESGASSYVILERADEPVNPGTPLNAETFRALAKDIAEQASGVSGEQIAQAVALYLQDHPVSGGSTATIGSVELLAANWVGSGNLYSQVVSVPGVTANSQVDLTPSVEQLVVFYEKDLTFVTEQENGVVTVYAIGQKPTNDYTIQVTITEVRV